MARLVTHIVTNPTLDGNGRFTETIGEFEKVTNAVVTGSGGFVPHIQAISGNIVTVEVRRTAVASHAAVALTGADLAATQADHATAARHPDHAAAVLAPRGPGAITAVFRIVAEGM